MGTSQECKEKIIKELKQLNTGNASFKGEKTFKILGNLYADFFCTKMKERSKC